MRRTNRNLHRTDGRRITSGGRVWRRANRRRRLRIRKGRAGRPALIAAAATVLVGSLVVLALHQRPDPPSTLSAAGPEPAAPAAEPASIDRPAIRSEGKAHRPAAPSAPATPLRTAPEPPPETKPTTRQLPPETLAHHMLFEPETEAEAAPSLPRPAAPEWVTNADARLQELQEQERYSDALSLLDALITWHTEQGQAEQAEQATSTRKRLNREWERWADDQLAAVRRLLRRQNLAAAEALLAQLTEDRLPASARADHEHAWRWVEHDRRERARDTASTDRGGHTRLRPETGTVTAAQLGYTVDRWEHGVQLTTRNYTIYTTVSEEAAVGVGRLMDPFFDRCLRVFQVSLKYGTGRKAQLYLFADASEYQQQVPRLFGVSAAGSAGLYFPGARALCVYLGPNRALPVQTLYHEGTHQFVDLGLAGRVPAWFNEGLATFFEVLEITPEGRIDTRPVNLECLPTLKAAFDQPNPPTLQEIVALKTHADFVPDQMGPQTIRNYALSWSVIHFLINSDRPAVGQLFEQLVEALRLNRGFYKLLTPRTVEQLEPLWRAHVEALLERRGQ